MNVATRLPRHPRSVSEARRAVSRFERVLDDETFATVKLLVSELVTNSVRHGGANDAGEVELAVWATQRAVRVEVADSGAGFSPLPREEDQDEGSGWGLHFLELLSDRWGTERDKGMRVWFEIDGVSAAAVAA